MASALKVPEQLEPLKRNSSYNLLPPDISELRLVVLGGSWPDRSSVVNLLMGETKCNTEEEPVRYLTVSGQLKETRLCVTITPDLLHPNISEDDLRKDVACCLSLSDPGPHVFLLVLWPEDFTKEQKLRLCSLLKLFGDTSFDRSLVLISAPKEKSFDSKEKVVLDQAFKDMIRKCRYRYLKLKNLESSELLTRLGQIVKENHGEHDSGDVLKSEDPGLIMTVKSETKHVKPTLNLVLCGRRGAGKTSAAQTILGERELWSESNPSMCVKHQREVCGRHVSVVELPALYGEPQEVALEESFKSMSLCDPKGVHAFILVVPVGSLTNEDKKEFVTIQNTFGSRMNEFTMILFTAETDPLSPAVVNFLKENRDIQELRQSCGGRHVVRNIKDKLQIPELLDAIEMMRPVRCFTKDMFTRAQIEKVTEKDKADESIAIQVEKILKEKQGEMKRKHEDLRRKHEEDLKQLKRKIKEQEGEIEQERQLRAKQLKEKDECINKEREERKKEREELEWKRKKHEDNQRQELKRRQDASEKIIQSERDLRENAARKLENERKEMRRDREAWEKERKDMWEQKRMEDKQNLEEWKTNYIKLQEEYYCKRRKWTYFFFGLSLSLLFSICYIFLR